MFTPSHEQFIFMNTPEERFKTIAGIAKFLKLHTNTEVKCTRTDTFIKLFWVAGDKGLFEESVRYTGSVYFLRHKDFYETIEKIKQTL